jgi:hypothetical protein
MPRKRKRDGIGWSSDRPVASGSSPGPLVGLAPATGLREPAVGSHKSVPCCRNPSPPDRCFGPNSTLLQVRGLQEHRGAASMPQEGQGRVWGGRRPSKGSRA